jgi:hypothetical protein
MLRFAQHDNGWLAYGAIANGTASGKLWEEIQIDPLSDLEVI